jgi:hypothetical protein
MNDSAIKSTDVGARPTSIEDLPLVMTPPQLAALLDCSERTLERERQDGVGIPFSKFGNRIYYMRDLVIRSLLERTCVSTAEAKRAAKETGR